MQKLTISMLLLMGLLTSCSKNKCEGKKKKDCVCLMNVDPVCGCNGVTYSNACVAGCEGIEEYTQGPCKQ